MLRLSPRLLFLAALPLTALHAQTPDDSLKGRIWTATAQRIWADTKPRAPQPPAWPTNAAFVSWLGTQGKSEKSGIGLLRGDVVRTLGPGKPATPAQVAQAILAEAGSPPPSRPWLRQLDVPALRTNLARLTPLAADTVRAGAAALATNDSTLAPPPPAGTTESSSSDGFFARHPGLAGLLGAVLGALGAAAALRALRPQRRSRHHPADLATPFPAHSTPQDSAEVLRLQNEVQRLVHYIKELEAKVLHYESASPASADPADEPALEPPVPPANLPHIPLPTDGPAVAAASTVLPAPGTAEPAVPPASTASTDGSTAHYAPIPEADFLADDQLTRTSRPELPLLLSPDPDQPDEADFTLNPHVDQARLIAEGLERLQHFFDYDAPPGAVSLVEGAAPGRLRRHEAGWQLLERGWLHVS